MNALPAWLSPDSLAPLAAIALGVGFVGLLIGLAIGLAGQRRWERRANAYLARQNALFKSGATSLEDLGEIERAYFVKAGELAGRYRELLARARMNPSMAAASPGASEAASVASGAPEPEATGALEPEATGAPEPLAAKVPRAVPAREWGVAVATVALLHLNEAIDMVAATPEGAAWIAALDPGAVRQATLSALPVLQAAEGVAIEALAIEGRFDPILRLAAVLDAYAPPAPAYAALEAAALLAAAGIKAVFAEADVAIDFKKPLSRIDRTTALVDADTPRGLAGLTSVKAMVLEAAVDVPAHQYLVVDPGVMGYRRGERVLATARPVVFHSAAWT